MLETMPISEKLKMLRDRRGLTLDELAEQTGLSRSALSNYETNESKEVSQFALVTLAKFYGVSTDYLLGLSELENPMQGDIHDLNISSEMAELLKSGKINNRLLCEISQSNRLLIFPLLSSSAISLLMFKSWISPCIGFSSSDSPSR